MKTNNILTLYLKGGIIMKKTIILVLTVLAVSFAGCGREEKEVFDNDNGPASSFDGQENILTENIEVEETLTENVEDGETEDEKLAKELEIARYLREQVCEEAKAKADKTKEIHTMTKEEVADLFEEHGLNEDFIMDKIRK